LKRIVLSVTNDIATDQRVNRVANTLSENFHVTIVGVKRKNSKKIFIPDYKTQLLWVPFQKGALFYASFNLILFFYLLFKKSEILVANDLDSLPANYLASILKRNKIVYDSHELFTEVPELVGRPRIQKVWLKIEKSIVPNLKYSYTVCDSIAQYYSSLYKVPFAVVRNVPFKKQIPVNTQKNEHFKNKKIIMYQGALNVGRGIENAILAMQYLDNTLLLIAGKGDIENNLKQLVEDSKLKDKVVFLGSLVPKDLFQYTCMADLGFSLEEHLGMSYYFALPNKLFDYIQAQVPVIVSNLPEMVAIVQKYQIGEIAKSHDPQQLALQFKDMLEDEEKRTFWKNNLRPASEELCWENEKEKLLEIFNQVK
jgi:glycosyltransferase involved in cell wall biosynthesis